MYAPVENIFDQRVRFFEICEKRIDALLDCCMQTSVSVRMPGEGVSYALLRLELYPWGYTNDRA